MSALAIGTVCSPVRYLCWTDFNSCTLYISSVIMITAFEMSWNHLLGTYFNHFLKSVEIDFF